MDDESYCFVDESAGGDHIRLTNWFSYVCPCTPLYLLTLSFNKSAWEGNPPMFIIAMLLCRAHSCSCVSCLGP